MELVEIYGSTIAEVNGARMIRSDDGDPLGMAQGREFPIVCLLPVGVNLSGFLFAIWQQARFPWSSHEESCHVAKPKHGYSQWTRRA
jgi:hypothetical protein